MSTSGSQEPLRLSKNDLYSPRVDAFLDEQAVLNRALPEAEPQPFLVRMFYSSYFYLSLASGLGAFLAWLIIEPFFDDDRGGPSKFQWAALLMFPTVAGFIGLFLGAAEGIMCRNPRAPRSVRPSGWGSASPVASWRGSSLQSFMSSCR